MNTFNPKDYLELGPTAILGLGLIWAIVQIARMKGGNGNGVKKELEKMNENHLTHIQECIAEGNNKLIETIHNDNIKVIEILSRIDGKIK